MPSRGEFDSWVDFLTKFDQSWTCFCSRGCDRFLDGSLTGFSSFFGGIRLEFDLFLLGF